MNALYFGCWLKPRCYTGPVLTQCSRIDGDRVVSELHMIVEHSNESALSKSGKSKNKIASKT